MRVVDLENQRLTVYIPEGLLDRLALRRIPNIQRGYIPIVGFCLARTWDGRQLGPTAMFFYPKPHMDDRR